jgi:nitrite reductase/ring-hydroxylating ferredoxin subunit
MTDDERRELDEPGAERLERYLDALFAGSRPSPDQLTDREEADVARLAAELSAAADPQAGEPDPAFMEQLRLRMRQADQGAANVRVPPPVRSDVAGQRGTLRISRRQVLQAGLAGAAGLAAGAAGFAFVRGALDGGQTGWTDQDLVPGDGEWVAVADEADLPVGAVIRFATPAFDGFVVNDQGEVRALASACTHLGCTLHYRPTWPDLRCPCHGASFNLRGWLANGPEGWRVRGPYRGDDEAYPIELPPLPRPLVRVAGGQVLVYTVREA